MAKPRAYPLAVQTGFGEDGMYAYSKGHHADAAFLAAAGQLIPDDNKLSTPRRIWWRVVPGRPGEDFDSYFHSAEPGSRGAFPVTVAEELLHGSDD